MLMKLLAALALSVAPIAALANPPPTTDSAGNANVNCQVGCSGGAGGGGVVTQPTASNLNALVTQGAAGAAAWKVDGSAVTQPVSAVSLPQHPVTLTDGTNTANVLAATSASNASGAQAAQLVAGAYKEVSFTTTTVQAVAATDVANYKWVSVQITGQGTSSAVAFQGSNDNSTWVNTALILSTAAGTTPAAVTTPSAGIFSGPITFRYFRLNVTGISAGTTAGVIEFFTQPPAMPVVSTPTLGAGTNTVGFVNLAAATTGGYSFVNMTTATTTTAKSGAGTLHSISINTKGATATATVFDNTAGSGTKIATIDLTLGQITLLYDVAFATGLTIVTTGGTPADITVAWK